MTVAFIIFAAALLVAGAAVVVSFIRRNARRPVTVAAAPRVVGTLRVYPDSGLSSTGDVEVIEPASFGPASPLLPVSSHASHAPAASQAPAAPLFDLDLEPSVTVPAAEIRWCSGFDPRSGTLDDVSRLRLIGDLGVVAKEWCVPLLCGAYEQESRPAHRQAALIALAACRSRAAAGTFRLALASGDAQERAIASDALADLEPPTQRKPRTFVERR